MAKYLILECEMDDEKIALGELNLTDGEYGIVRELVFEQCQRSGKVVVFAQYIDTVRPGSPQWDSEKPAPAPQVDAFKVGEPVEVRLFVDPVYKWVSAVVEDNFGCAVRVSVAGVHFGTFESPSQVRRPAPSQPAVFEFGQRVRVSDSYACDERLRGKLGVVLLYMVNKTCRVWIESEEEYFHFVQSDLIPS